MDIRTLLAELEAYAKARKVLPGTICREAGVGFSLHARLVRRAAQTEKDAQRLRSHMAANPVIEGVTEGAPVK